MERYFLILSQAFDCDSRHICGHLITVKAKTFPNLKKVVDNAMAQRKDFHSMVVMQVIELTKEDYFANYEKDI